jgi:hypothetical protein
LFRLEAFILYWPIIVCLLRLMFIHRRPIRHWSRRLYWTLTHIYMTWLREVESWFIKKSVLFSMDFPKN